MRQISSSARLRRRFSARVVTRAMVAGGLLLTSSPAWALKLCLIDFQTAVTATAEGKAAQTKIDSMYSSRKSELERMQTELEKAIQDYQSRAMILSAEAKAGETDSEKS